MSEIIVHDQKYRNIRLFDNYSGCTEWLEHNEENRKYRENRILGQLEKVRLEVDSGMLLWDGHLVTADQYHQMRRLDEKWRIETIEKIYTWYIKIAISCKLYLDEFRKNKSYETNKIYVIETCYKVALNKTIVEAKKVGARDLDILNPYFFDLNKILNEKPFHNLPYHIVSEIIESKEACDFLDEVIQYLGTEHSLTVANLIMNEFRKKDKEIEKFFCDEKNRRDFLSNMLNKKMRRIRSSPRIV